MQVFSVYMYFCGDKQKGVSEVLPTRVRTLGGITQMFVWVCCDCTLLQSQALHKNFEEKFVFVRICFGCSYLQPIAERHELKGRGACVLLWETPGETPSKVYRHSPRIRHSLTQDLLLQSNWIPLVLVFDKLHKRMSICVWKHCPSSVFVTKRIMFSRKKSDSLVRIYEMVALHSGLRVSKGSFGASQRFLERVAFLQQSGSWLLWSSIACFLRRAVEIRAVKMSHTAVVVTAVVFVVDLVGLISALVHRRRWCPTERLSCSHHGRCSS